jgi:hypothetical protein
MTFVLTNQNSVEPFNSFYDFMHPFCLQIVSPMIVKLSITDSDSEKYIIVDGGPSHDYSL